MVRSHWIGPVFGVLALTGLALGQTATPHVPVPAGDAGEQVVTVQETGIPAQKCMVLKRWVEPDGSHAYVVQALDSGERMTIEEVRSLAPPMPHGGRQGFAMRIFHWGRQGEGMPPGIPMPPDGVAAGPPAYNHMIPAQASSVAASPMPKTPPPPPAVAPRQPQFAGPFAGPAVSPVVMKVDTTPNAASGPVVSVPPASGPIMTGEKCEACQCAPPVVGRIEPVPSDVGPVVSEPGHSWPFTSGPVKIVEGCPSCSCESPVVTKVEPAPYPPVPSLGGWRHPTPPDCVVMEPTITLPPPPPGKNAPPCAGVAQALPPAKPGFKLLDPSTWKGAPPADAHGPSTVADAGAKKPATDGVKAPPDAGSKTPGAVAKVPTTPAQPGDWRESWGKIDGPKLPTSQSDLPAMPSAAAESPARPNLSPTPTVATLAAGQTAPTAVPAKRPDAAPASPTVAAPAHTTVLPSAVALVPRPDVAPTPPTLITPATPPAAAPAAVVALPPALGPTTAPKAASPAVAALPPVPGPNPVDLPHAQPKADDPLADPKKYVRIPHAEDTFGKTDPTAKAKLPLGMQSALAAVAPNDPNAPGGKSGPDAAMGFDPNEPNAFSEPKGKSSGAANAFTDPPPPPPPPQNPPQGVDLASNAFAGADRTQPLGAPAPVMAAPRLTDSALPTRALPPPAPPPAPAAPLSVNLSTPRPMAPVVPAGYRPGNAYDLTPIVAVLRESLYPSQREDAAEQLGALDWRRQPEIVDILVERAKEDPAPTVRAECVRSLNRLKANTVPAVEVVKTLQADDDPRVRHEADDAYAALTGMTPKAGEPADGSAAH